MAERKRFHCGDNYCLICNTKEQVHKNQIEYWKLRERAQEEQERKIVELKFLYNGMSLWERLKYVLG